MPKIIKTFLSVGGHPQAISGIDQTINTYLRGIPIAKSIQILQSSVALQGGSAENSIRIIYTVIVDS